MPEWVFRVAGFVLLLVYRLIRKAWERKLRSRLKEEPRIVRAPARERILLTVMGLLTVPLFVWFFGPWLDFARFPLPEWARWVGAGICAAGVWYFSETHRALAQNWSPLLEIRDGATLVTSGPYRYVRHPMYSSAMVIYAGFALLCANWLVAVTLLAGVVVVFVGRFRDEEQMMLDAFGDEYRDYMTRTGRVIPKLPALRGRE
jgi:protein-S-isoprenylcysteine O-methyltransferase Ste14